MIEEKVPEAELVRRAKGGDLKAFDALFSTYSPKIYRYFQRAWGGILPSHDHREDAVAEVFVRAYRSLHTFRGELHFITWLYAIARNHGCELGGKAIRRPETVPLDAVLAEALVDDADPAALVERNWTCEEVREEVRQAVDEIPRLGHRNAVYLRHLMDFSYEQVARALVVPPGTARIWVHRGILSLARILRERGYPEKLG